MQPIKVLLVEDEPSFSLAIAATLKQRAKQPVSVETVGWLSAALEHVGRPDIDVVLLDLSLPDSNGLDTIDTIRKHSKFVPIIVLTGNEDDLALDALQMGAQDYLLKGKIEGELLWRSIKYAMERARLLELRDEFVATLSHDLKTPIFGANRVLNLMAEGAVGQLTDEQSTLLNKLQLTNHYVLSIIENLLDAYRLDKDVNALVMNHTNLGDLLQTCIQQLQPLAEDKQVAIEQDVHPDIPEIMADQHSMCRVIHNLLDNAVKFSPPGGTITVRLFDSPSSVSLEVADTGPGISPEDESVLFERFGRGLINRHARSGTGLGLFVSKRIVELHGGSISFRRGNGATFTVELPVAAHG